MPAIWHSNPLAGSPPAKRPQLHLDPAAAELAADGATTVRPMQPAAAAAAGAGAAVGAPEPRADDDGEWHWESGTAASSPSLRLPACESAGELQASAAQAHAQQRRQTGSQGSCGGGAVESLSQRWELPSPGAGNTT